MKPIEQLIGEAFASELGQQCPSLFSTSDNRIFIRYSEALSHTASLENKAIYEWFEEWQRNTPNEIVFNNSIKCLAGGNYNKS